MAWHRQRKAARSRSEARQWRGAWRAMLDALRLYSLGLQALPRINIKRLVVLLHAAIFRVLCALEWLHESLHGYPIPVWPPACLLLVQTLACLMVHSKCIVSSACTLQLLIMLSGASSTNCRGTMTGSTDSSTPFKEIGSFCAFSTRLRIGLNKKVHSNSTEPRRNSQ